MVGRRGRRSGAPSKNIQKGAGKAIRDGSDIYQDMLEEAGVAGPEQNASAERPLKRRRVGARAENRSPIAETESRVNEREEQGGEESDDDEDVEFYDVVIPAPTVQTMEQDSDEDDDDDDDGDDLQFEDVDPSLFFKDLESTTEEPQELEINLTSQKLAATQANNATGRRKPLTREEKEQRVYIHKVHLLCLLSHVARRNNWCNDPKVQDALRPHLTDKMIRYLTPGTNLSQFGRTESLKNGLKMAVDMWKQKFEITERGIRRALWAEDAEHLKDYEPPTGMDTCFDREDFREAAKKLQGSRDVGAQLFCALLRCAGVRARLVCSLQPLSFLSGGPTLPRPKGKAGTASKTSTHEQVLAQITKHREMLEGSSSASPAGSSARRRLGHPNAMAHNFVPLSAPQQPVSTFWPKRIRETSHPVYWIEILDVGHQKWQPVDPVMTLTYWKPRALEPPFNSKANYLCYVVAFDADHTAKDVTRRYAKVYTAKTLKLRVERGAEDGEKWWRKVMRKYQSGTLSDLDQIEDIELTGVIAQEPMPRNVQDFKNHPVYALERHLLRHQVLAPGAKPSGTVSAGSRAPLEKVYRRRDVLVAKSAERWFRLGRQVKGLEIPVKWLPKRPRNKNRMPRDEDEINNDNDGDAGTPIYTMDQTELFVPPPVRQGKVPKNKFGNIEIYTPSMVPEGGVHLVDDHAVKAAYLLGIDYAPALTAFQFTGRHGTAVLRGAVVAQEYEEAMQAVIGGLGDVEQEIEDDKKRLVALTLWRRLLMGLRIRERIWSGVSEEERREADREAELEAELRGAESDVTEEMDVLEDEDDEDDDGGGGFLVE